MFKKFSYFTGSLLCTAFLMGSTSVYAALDCDTVCRADVCSASPRVVQACQQQCGRNPVMRDCMNGARQSPTKQMAPEADPLEGGFGNMFDEPTAPNSPVMPISMPMQQQPMDMGQSMEQTAAACPSDQATQNSVRQAIEILQGIQQKGSIPHAEPGAEPSMMPPPPAPRPPMMPPKMNQQAPRMQQPMGAPTLSFEEQLRQGRNNLRPMQPNQRPPMGVNEGGFAEQFQNARNNLRPMQPNQRPPMGVNEGGFAEQLQNARSNLRPTQPNQRPPMGVNEGGFAEQLQNAHSNLRPTQPNQHPQMGVNEGGFAEQLRQGRQNLRPSQQSPAPEIFHNKESKSPLDRVGSELTRRIGGLTGAGQ